MRGVLLFAGASIGIAATLLLQPARGASEANGRYQLVPLPNANSVIWRMDTATGQIERCFNSNYDQWLTQIKNGQPRQLEGYCTVMQVRN